MQNYGRLILGKSIFTERRVDLEPQRDSWDWVWNVPEVLCAVLVREPLWLEARMDDQALLEGIVVFSDEDGPGKP